MADRQVTREHQHGSRFEQLQGSLEHDMQSQVLKDEQVVCAGCVTVSALLWKICRGEGRPAHPQEHGPTCCSRPAALASVVRWGMQTKALLVVQATNARNTRRPRVVKATIPIGIVAARCRYPLSCPEHAPVMRSREGANSRHSFDFAGYVGCSAE